MMRLMLVIAECRDQQNLLVNPQANHQISRKSKSASKVHGTHLVNQVLLNSTSNHKKEFNSNYM